MNGMSRNEETGQLRIHFPYYLSLTSDYYSTPRLTPEERGIQEEIVTAYRALFVLIRSDVVPYMNQKAKDGKIKEKKREMFRIVKRMEKEQERHEQEVGRRKASIAALEKHHEARIGNLRKAIAKLSQELDKM
jgi:hypothetical protein